MYVYVCMCYMCVSVHERCLSTGAIPERTREAEKGMGESTARGGGGGEETQ